MKMNKLILYADYALVSVIAIMCLTFLVVFPWLVAHNMFEQSASQIPAYPITSDYAYAVIFDILILVFECSMVWRIGVLCARRMDEIANTLKGVQRWKI